MKRAAVALLAAIVGGAPARAERYLNFACDDGAKISLIFEKSRTGQVIVEGGALRHQNCHPALCYWYASPYDDLRVRDKTASFRMQERAPTTCTLN